jgi:hypothetical protein
LEADRHETLQNKPVRDPGSPSLARLRDPSARFLPASTGPGGPSRADVEDLLGVINGLTDAVHELRAEMAEMRRTRSIAS